MNGGHHDTFFVGLSILIAVLGSWTALDLNGRARARERAGAGLHGSWLAATAFAMGLSIWSMHFVAMLGFDAGFPVAYDPSLTITSLVIAIATTAAAFAITQVPRPGRQRLLGAAVLMGSGICLMHYLGMAAMRRSALLSYDPGLVVLSFVIASAASWAALVARLRERGMFFKVIGAVLLGLAIAAMHYTGMRALSIAPRPGAMAEWGADRLALGFGVASSTMLLLFLALLSATFDRRFEAQSLRETRLLSERAAHLRAVLGQLPVGVLVASARTAVVESANAEAIRLLRTDPTGRRLPDPAGIVELASIDGRALEPGEYPLVRTLKSGRRVDGLPMICRLPDGSSFHAEISTAPILNADGSIGSVVLALVDKTSQVLAEQSLRESQKLAAIGQLTGGIAHDFNNLLTGIIGSLDLMERRGGIAENETAARYLGIARSSAQRAAALTQRLLAFGRRQSLDLKRVGVGALITGMEDMLRRTIGEQIRLDFAIETPDAAVRTDPSQLENALLNLVINARDAMPSGGSITVSTAETVVGEADRADGEGPAPGRYLLLTVADTGTGMTPEVLAKVFEPFFTTKPIGQGTGLGLSTIYGFVRQAGGGVSVASEPGQGTRVTLFLPLAGEKDEPADGAAEDATGQAPRGRGERLLVVEDEASVRSLLGEALRGLGYATVEAADAQAALAILDRGTAVDLLVTDVGLPGLNGRQLAELARARRPGIKVLFVTGYAEQAANRGEFLEPGMAMLPKPFSVDVLGGAIRAMFERRPAPLAGAQ